MCVDYRQLNSKTVKDSYALPKIEDILDCLHGSCWFSTLDMKSGYHQVEVEESHKERTAFALGPLGFWKFNKLPFGCTNSPASFQRIVEEILRDYNMNICIIYLDDLIIYSSTFQEHIERLNLLLARLAQAGIKLSPEKCFFLQIKTKFLGHVVGPESVEPYPDKCNKVRDFPTPTNPDQLRSFLAAAGYYHKFIKDFSKIAKPLNDLLSPTSTKKGVSKKSK